MKWYCKVFKWCDGLGVDINLDIDVPYCRSRVMFNEYYVHPLGYDSCCIVSFIKEEDESSFVEMNIDYDNFEWFMNVYDVVHIMYE